MKNNTFHNQTVSVFALAVATLLFESTLTRLLAVAQFYHFAFLVVSLALLGFGASGTLLSIFPRLSQIPIEQLLFWTGVGLAGGIGLAYAGVNWLPFDSYSIAWERRQIIFFVIYYLALTVPFLISGLGIGAALALADGKSHVIYAANLLGSAFGAMLAPVFLTLAGVPGAVMMSVCIGLVAGISPFGWRVRPRSNLQQAITLGFLCLVLLSFGGLVAMNGGVISPLGMNISPYKGLSYARLYPESKLLYGRWNAISRVDVIENAGTRRLPGLSYQYIQTPPPQLGMSIDADALQPITLTKPETFEAADWLPEALAFNLIPGAEALVIEPGGGLGVLQALAGGAKNVTAIIENHLIPSAVRQTAGEYQVYSHPKVKLVREASRAYLMRPGDDFDVIYLPLTDAYRPVTSGAYSLAESYSLTVESFRDALKRVSPSGVLVVTRWLQSPPSESLRLVATLVEALSETQQNLPAEVLLAYRSIQTMTVLVKPAGWTEVELKTAREFVDSRRFDWVWAPDLKEEEINRYNQLPEPLYYNAVSDLLTTTDRGDIYTAYPYNIRPTRDKQPFFFHFFTSRQTAEVLQTIGHTWQPFGGSGYLILFALLALVVLLSAGLILIPLLWRGRAQSGQMPRQTNRRVFLYFSLLGVAFLFVEIPLIQRWILILGQPIYAFATVVASLLMASGVGSILAKRDWISTKYIFGFLVSITLLVILLIGRLSAWILPWPVWGRVAVVVFSLAPLGLLMGMPFPLGLSWLEDAAPNLTPWAWAINGCASVIASVMAAILTLSYGFNLVMLIGALAYGGAYLILKSGKRTYTTAL